jgi:hypothetical protein
MVNANANLPLGRDFKEGLFDDAHAARRNSSARRLVWRVWTKLMIELQRCNVAMLIFNDGTDADQPGGLRNGSDKEVVAAVMRLEAQLFERYLRQRFVWDNAGRISLSDDHSAGVGLAAAYVNARRQSLRKAQAHGVLVEQLAARQSHERALAMPSGSFTHERLLCLNLAFNSGESIHVHRDNRWCFLLDNSRGLRAWIRLLFLEPASKGTKNDRIMDLW